MFARIFECQGNELICPEFCATTHEAAAVTQDRKQTSAEFAAHLGIIDTGRYIEFSFGDPVKHRRVQLFGAGTLDSAPMYAIKGPALDYPRAAMWVGGEPEDVKAPE